MIVFVDVEEIALFMTLRDSDGSKHMIDNEEFPDYETAIVRAKELAERYRVRIDHRY